MDVTIYPVSGAGQQFTPSPLKVDANLTPLPVPHTDGAAPPQISLPSKPSAPDPTSQNEAALRQAALSFKDVYAVSDQSFSIFKDVTGKYITRYISLRDGTITYEPAPTFVRPPEFSRLAISV